MKTNVQKLNEILAHKHITPVYQPIVCLNSGNVFAYEALSRISSKELNMPIDEMFALADKTERAWELEALCRSKALENCTKLPKDTNLFLNVNPNILHDENFRDGFTLRRLEKFNISPKNIVFEITERVSITEQELFYESVNHYKNQNYNIAIDDVGSGFSGLNVIVGVKPAFIKLDMYLVRDIHKDAIKLHMCSALTDFCKKAGIKIIAEGIENEGELKALTKIGVNYGQGYFLAMPKMDFEPLHISKSKLVYNIGKSA